MLGENGLIKRAELAREKQQIAEIKEEAEIVKADAYIEYKQNKKTLTQTDIVKELNEHFEGSIVSGNTVTTVDGKYDIIVDENLNITVKKHEEGSGGNNEPQVTIDISHTIDTLDENTKIINLNYTIIEPEVEISTELIEEKAERMLGGTITEDIKEEINNQATALGITYRELLLELIGQEVADMEITEEIRANLKSEATNNGMTYEETLIDGLEQEYGVFFTAKKQEISTEQIEEKLQEKIGTNITEDIRNVLNNQATAYGITYRELLLELIGQEVADMEITEEIRANLKSEADKRGITYEEFLLYILEAEGVSFSNVTIKAWLGNKEVDVKDLQIYAKRSGIYKVIVETEDGIRGEEEVTVEGIINEKFSEIYIASAEYTDNLGNKAKIPAGFAVGVSEDINRIDTGLVITDSVDSEGYSNGNEYIWIPVSNINGDGSNKIKKIDGSEVEITLGRYAFSENSGEPELKQAGIDYASETVIKLPSTLNIEYKELKDFRQSVDGDGTNGLNETAKDLAGFISSVEQNGGFFIARYEASYESGSSVSNYKLASKVSTLAIDGDNSTLTRGKLWNNIKQGTIAKVCKNMYTENENVEADLVNSYAWDTAIVFIQKCSNNSNYANKDDGNGKIRNTGLTGDVVCNIYDMAGNMGEWTTESNIDSSDVNLCIHRGGDYFDTTYCVESRACMFAAAAGRMISGRPLLYVK